MYALSKDDLGVLFFMNTWVCTGPQRENFPGGTKGDTGPPNLIGPPKPYRVPCRKIIFCRMGVDLHLKGGGNDIRIQLGPMKNTARHRIGLNLARGTGGAL